mmetsp:Transcript_16051/g.48227  ORF Transcript_16051/g.48227 Transcript_16051/m.48227 type:complete len:351 (-) Transcript_16051:63-1115(-)
MDVRRLVDGPGARRRLGGHHRAARGVQGPVPRRRPHPGALRHGGPRGQPAPDELARARGRQVRRRRRQEAAAVVRPRAGVHAFQPRRHDAARLARRRLPEAPGPVLLRRGRGQELRPRGVRGALPRVPLRGPHRLGHQRGGHAGPVGVPDRPRRRHRRGGPAHHLALHPRPRLRGPRRHRLHRAQAHRGRLERRGHAHQLLDGGHAQGGRPRGHRGHVREARDEARRAHRRVRVPGAPRLVCFVRSPRPLLESSSECVATTRTVHRARPGTARATRSASRAPARPPTSTRSRTASRTAAAPSASRATRPPRAAATSRTAARRRTSTRTSRPRSSSRRARRPRLPPVGSRV